MSTGTGPSTIQSEERWRRVEELLGAVVELSHSHLPAHEFARQVLSRILAAMPSVAAGFWSVDAANRPLAVARLRHEGAPLEPSVSDGCRLRQIEEVLKTRRPVASAIPSELMLLICPITIDDACVGALELIRPENEIREDRQWALEVLQSTAELCAADFRARRLKRVAEQERLWRRLRTFAVAVHHSLDLSETAYAVANDGRPLVGCDRLTILSDDDGSLHVLAVSGAAICDPRSDAVRQLERLAAAVAAADSPFVFPSVRPQPQGAVAGEWEPPGHSETAVAGAARAITEDLVPPGPLPPEIRTPLTAFLDESGAKSLAIVPLCTPSADRAQLPDATVGMLVAEQFSGTIDSNMLERLQLIAEHASCALRNARQYHRAPWAALVGEERWQRLTAGRSRLRLWLYAAAGLFFLGWIIPARYEIEARGELQPRVRRDVFAPDDAVVEELKVDHDDRVEAGQVVALLRNPQLDLEAKRVSGELQTTRERLAAVQAARVELAAESAGRPAGAARLSGEEAALRAQLVSLERQSKLLDAQQAALTVRSPITGRILTWNLPQLLQSRPVQRGQVLMTIADPEGEWALELHVPEDSAGTLLSARQSEPNLPVTYVAATDPSRKRRARIDNVAASIEPGRRDEGEVLVTAGVDRQELQNPRPGAGATGHIRCGWRPLAYVWFHDVIDAAWAWLWF